MSQTRTLPSRLPVNNRSPPASNSRNWTAARCRAVRPWAGRLGLAETDIAIVVSDRDRGAVRRKRNRLGRGTVFISLVDRLAVRHVPEYGHTRTTDRGQDRAVGAEVRARHALARRGLAQSFAGPGIPALIVPSLAAVATILPSGPKATRWTGPPCLNGLASMEPVARSQSRAAPSSPAVASLRPSGQKATS